MPELSPELSPTQRNLNTLTRIREQFLRDLEAHEGDALGILVREYAGIIQRLRDQIEQDWERIEARKAAGETPRRSWLYEEARLRRLLDQAEGEFRAWSTLAEQFTAQLQQKAIDIAGQSVASQLQFLLTPPSGGTVVAAFDILPADALAHLTGTLRDGSPLVKLFAEIGQQVRGEMSKALADGIVMGDNPRTVGRRMSRSTAVGLARGIRIARTEMMRSYRTAHHENYRANSDVLASWIWTASLNGRTCAACLAMHGTFHKLGEELLDHPNGRCTPIPVTKSWSQLGLGDQAKENGWGDSAIDPEEVETGEEWFKQQPPALKVQVLGSAGASAYDAGQVKLRDFVDVHRSRVWGNSITARGLAGAMEHARLD